MPFYYGPVDEEEVSFVLDETPVAFATGDVILEGYLATHAEAREAIVLADAGPCSRDVREMRYIAEALQEIGLATFHVDLLTEEEAGEGHDVQSRVGLLAERLVAALDWLHQNPQTAGLKWGYFGQGSAAAAGLNVAAGRPDSLAALVLINGVLESGPWLSGIEAPVLLVAGQADQQALELTERARTQLRGDRQLAILPGSGDMLAEPALLPQVARLARGWFSRYLSR